MDYTSKTTDITEQRETNLSDLISLHSNLTSKIEEFQAEIKSVKSLFTYNIYLANFIKKPLFEQVNVMRFEDECMYLHMELSEEFSESKYWEAKVKEKLELRDEFYSHYKELLPNSKGGGAVKRQTPLNIDDLLKYGLTEQKYN
jgi:hypothetical protein